MINRRGKRDSVTTVRTEKTSVIDRFGNDSIYAEGLQISDAHPKQNDSIS